MTIETIYEWMCPQCHRVFRDTNRSKLEEFKELHLGSHKHETEKWESHDKVKKIM